MSKTESQIFIEIGRILMAHEKMIDLKFHFKQYLKLSKHSFQNSQNNYHDYGWRSRMGDEVTEEYHKSKGIESALQMVQYEIDRFHKHFVLLKSQFRDNYPDYEETLDHELNENLKKIQRYFHQKNRSPEHTKMISEKWLISTIYP